MSIVCASKITARKVAGYNLTDYLRDLRVDYLPMGLRRGALWKKPSESDFETMIYRKPTIRDKPPLHPNTRVRS